MALERKDTLLYGVLTDKTMDEDGVLLSYAIGTVGRLVLDCGIPPRVNDEDMVSRRQRQPDTARLQR
jgi:hypothetical protein